MNLQEQINRINEMMGILNESRRLNLYFRYLDSEIQEQYGDLSIFEGVVPVVRNYLITKNKGLMAFTENRKDKKSESGYSTVMWLSNYFKIIFIRGAEIFGFKGNLQEVVLMYLSDRYGFSADSIEEIDNVYF